MLWAKWELLSAALAVFGFSCFISIMLSCVSGPLTIHCWSFQGWVWKWCQTLPLMSRGSAQTGKHIQRSRQLEINNRPPLRIKGHSSPKVWRGTIRTLVIISQTLQEIKDLQRHGKIRLQLEQVRLLYEQKACQDSCWTLPVLKVFDWLNGITLCRYCLWKENSTTLPIW